MAEIVSFPKELACQMPSFTALLAGTLLDLRPLISQLFPTLEHELSLSLLPVRSAPSLRSLRVSPDPFEEKPARVRGGVQTIPSFRRSRRSSPMLRFHCTVIWSILIPRARCVRNSR